MGRSRSATRTTGDTASPGTARRSKASTGWAQSGNAKAIQISERRILSSPADRARPHVPVSGADRTLAEDYAPLGVKQRLAVEMQCQPRPLPLPRQRKRRPQTGPPLSFSSRAVRDCCRLAHSTPSHTVRSKLSRKTRHGWQPSPLTDARGERGSAGATRACMHSPRVPWRNSRRTYGARTHNACNRGDRSCRPTRPASGCDDAAPFDAGVPHAHGDGA